MNDRDVPVYLSPDDVELLMSTLGRHARTRQGNAERDAHALSDRLRDALDQYRDDVKQAKGRRRRPDKERG